MNITQALSILKPNPMSADGLKKAYRENAMKYHPDHNPHGLEMMKLITQAHQALQANLALWTVGSTERKQWFDETFYKRHTGPSIAEEMQVILDGLIKFRNITVEIIGTWLWVTGETKPYKETLKGMGLWYSPKKTAWYWKPADWQPADRKQRSLDDLRGIFRSEKFETEPDEEIVL